MTTMTLLQLLVLHPTQHQSGGGSGSSLVRAEFLSSTISSTTFLRPSTRPQPHLPRSSLTRITDRGLQRRQRGILVIRILDAPEDSATTLDRHSTLRAVLFDGGDDITTMPSVQQQMQACSGNSVLFVPQPISDTNDHFIMDIVVDPTLITDQSSRNEWVEVMASIACDPDTGPLRQLIGTNPDGNVFTLEPDDDYYYTSLLRQVADHVIVVLPGTYPDDTFLATAEIGNRLSMYSVAWATSLSTYMHELAHNLGLRHSGDTIYSDIELDTEYGDSSGYMGESMSSAWTPQKCYNAAQHWQLGWFEGGSNEQPSVSFRLSLSDDSSSPQLPLRINVAAFVDYSKIVSSLDANSSDESFVVLVQVTPNIYLQYNRAKAYNVGTDTVYANEIVIVEQDSDDLSTRVLASLQSDESYVTVTDTNRIIHVCDIIMNDTNNDVIDYAIIAISDSHNTGTISSVCQNGPDFVHIRPSVPSATTTTAPSEPPTSNTVVASPSPSMAPVVSEMSPPPTVEEMSLPTVMPTTLVENDVSAGSDTEDDEMPQPTVSPISSNDKDADDNRPTNTPTNSLNLRGSDTAEGNSSGNGTTALTNQSSSENGLPTSSIIYTVFGTLLGAVIISIVVLFYLGRHSKPSCDGNRCRSPTRPRSSKSSRSSKQQQPFVVASGSSRTMKSPDGSPTSRHTDLDNRKLKDDGEERSKNTAPSATTRSSSQQKPKLVLEKQKQRSGKNPRDEIKINDVEDDDDSSDDDQSDTLSVILQQEIWKDRVHKILQSVFFVHDKDGTVTQMMPAARSNRPTKVVAQPKANEKDHV